MRISQELDSQFPSIFHNLNRLMSGLREVQESLNPMDRNFSQRITNAQGRIRASISEESKKIKDLLQSKIEELVSHIQMLEETIKSFLTNIASLCQSLEEGVNSNFTVEPLVPLGEIHALVLAFFGSYDIALLC